MKALVGFALLLTAYGCRGPTPHVQDPPPKRQPSVRNTPPPANAVQNEPPTATAPEIPAPPSTGPYATIVDPKQDDEDDKDIRELWVRLLTEMSLDAARDRWSLSTNLLADAWKLRADRTAIQYRINERFRLWGTSLQIKPGDLERSPKRQYYILFRETLASAKGWVSLPPEQQDREIRVTAYRANRDEQMEIDRLTKLEAWYATDEGQAGLTRAFNEITADRAIDAEREARKRQFNGQPYLRKP